MAIMAPFEIGDILMRALNLPKLTRRFELIVEVDEPVIVRCEYYPENSNSRHLLELKNYVLEARDDEWVVWRRPYLDACRGW